MTNPASTAKHPIHPMLVVLPMGLWIFSLVIVMFLVEDSLHSGPGWLPSRRLIERLRGRGIANVK